MAENIAENARPLARFRSAERERTGAKRLKRGHEIPVAVLVRRVTLKKRFDLTRSVRVDLPRLTAAIRKAMSKVADATGEMGALELQAQHGQVLDVDRQQEHAGAAFHQVSHAAVAALQFALIEGRDGLAQRGQSGIRGVRPTLHAEVVLLGLRPAIRTGWLCSASTATPCWLRSPWPADARVNG
ncbi:DUF6441 family protein [Ralstonia mannitolilytica]|uniref:DUF6441 family protein n=1 Tax=Ralstonia mannitolilytica TaxID=105219 RepID=UPI0028F636D7|nr:DUF6441 family protein [Ralstonia mannitolilytica]CAJ0716396.1 hypothetical protein LMG8323_03229 [Ralstonia mannitolilytica]